MPRNVAVSLILISLTLAFKGAAPGSTSTQPATKGAAMRRSTLPAVQARPDTARMNERSIRAIPSTASLARPDSASGASRETIPSSLAVDAVKVGLTALALLLGLLVRSPIKKSEDIKDRLLNYKFTFVDDSKPGEIRAEQRAALRREIDDLHHLFDRYDLAYKEFIKLSWWTWATLGAVVLLAAISTPLTWTPPVLTYLLAIIVLPEAIVLFALRSIYMVKPDVMRSVHYLVNEMDVNVDLLVAAMNASLSFNSTREHPAKKDPLRAQLSTDLRVVGFRFLCVLFNDKGDVFFASFGPVEKTSGYSRHLIPPGTFIEQSEMVLYHMGEAPLNLVREAQELRALLLVFMAVYQDKEMLPFFTRGTHTAHGADAETYVIGGGAGGFDLRTDWAYSGVRFSAKGTKITRLWVKEGVTEDTPGETEAVHRVITKFNRRIRSAGRVEVEFSAEGQVAR